MFDVGWPELLLIMAVAVLVIGPDEIPGIMLNLGRIARRLQYVKFALSQQFEDLLRDNELEEMRRDASKREHSTDPQTEKDADHGA